MLTKNSKVTCPVTFQWLRPTHTTAKALRIFLFLNSDATINGLIREVPLLPKTRHLMPGRESGGGSSTQSDFLIGPLLSRRCFWFSHLLLVQPPSAASESFLTQLSASFNNQQECALSDYLQASMMPQYKKC